MLQKSARYLVPVIKVIAGTDESVWRIDANSYTDTYINILLQLAKEISDALAPARRSDTLLTKILLGVFGSVPAFDDNFVAACRPEGICATFGRRALREIGQFYDANKEAIEERLSDFRTLDFESGELTSRNYTRAKLIDMVLYARGEKLIALREAKKRVKS